MSSQQRIRDTFQRMGYPAGTFIRQGSFYTLLDQLSGGQFDREIAQQLWEQAAMGTDRDVRIQELSDIISDAQRILNGKIQEIGRDVNQLMAQRRRVAQTPMNQRDKQNEIRRLDYELQQAKKDLIEYEDDLRFVTFPFQGTANSHYSQNSSYLPQFQGNRLTNNSIGPIGTSIGTPMGVPIGVSQFPLQAPSNIPFNNQSQFNQSQFNQSGYQQVPQKIDYYDNSMVSTVSINQDLKIVLWIAIAIGVLEIIIMYKKYDFLNLLIIVTLLSIFLLDYFDSTYIKVCVGLVAFSIVLDIFWLCMYASTFWSPPLYSQHNQGDVVYLRFIVLFTLIILIIKMPLVILLLKYRDIPANTNFTVPVYGKTQLNVVSNRGNNLVSQGCGHLPIF